MHQNSSSYPPRLRRVLLAVAGAVVGGFALASAASAQSDLAPISIIGPGQVSANGNVLVTINVINFGDPLAEEFTAEVVLSEDSTVDGLDLVVGSATNQILGGQTFLVSVPVDVDPGVYFWGVRLLPVTGEIAVGNNAVIGTQINVLKSILAIGDADPIGFLYRPTDNELPPPATILVSNVGSESSIVIFLVEMLTPASWLEVSATEGFAVESEGGFPVVLSVIPDGLPLGTYETTLRFRNWGLPDNFVDVDVSLSVGPPKFRAGDRLKGVLATVGEVDDIKFDGVVGMRLLLKGKILDGEDMKLKVEIVDPNDQVEETITFEMFQAFQKAKHRLAMSGEYSLRISSENETQGSYIIKTNRKLSKKSKPRTVKSKNPGIGDSADVEVRVLPGAILDFSVDPNAEFAGPINLGFTTPSGASVNINAIAEAGNGTDDLVVENLGLDEYGSFYIHVSGFGIDESAKAMIHVLPFQPPRGDTKLYIP